jgi:hypothetical protein
MQSEQPFTTRKSPPCYSSEATPNLFGSSVGITASKLERNFLQEQEFLPAMKAKWIASSLLAFAVAVTGATSAHALQGPPPPGWDAPPPSYRTDIERRGFHDGIIGAQKDWMNHRRPGVLNRDEYRHPVAVPRPMWRAYQNAFQRGYNVGVRRYYGPRY